MKRLLTTLSIMIILLVLGLIFGLAGNGLLGDLTQRPQTELLR